MWKEELRGVMRMRERKAWAELSQAEVAALKRKQCCKCAYFSRNGTTDLLNATCDYILDEVRNPKGHRRPCEPRDCVEKGVFIPKKKDKRKRRKKIAI